MQHTDDFEVVKLLNSDPYFCTYCNSNLLVFINISTVLYYSQMFSCMLGLIFISLPHPTPQALHPQPCPGPTPPPSAHDFI